MEWIDRNFGSFVNFSRQYDAPCKFQKLTKYSQQRCYLVEKFKTHTFVSSIRDWSFPVISSSFTLIFTLLSFLSGFVDKSH